MSDIDNNEFVKVDRCPLCRHKVNSALCYNDPDARPSVGDFSVCIKCAAPLEFDENMNLIVADPLKLDIDTLIEIKKIQKLIIEGKQ